MQTRFKLDSRLANDCFTLHYRCDHHILLMNDSRWPWLIVVPNHVGMRDWIDLPDNAQRETQQVVHHVGQWLKTYTQCYKLNIASLGNVVEQLHIHIIARNIGDANWPTPVWGYGEAVPYKENIVGAMSANLQEFLGEL